MTEAGALPGAGGPQRWSIGDTTLVSIVEAETPVPASLLIPDATADDVRAADGLPPGSASPDGATIGFRVQAFVLQHRGKVIVVDPCVGNQKSLKMALWNDLDLPWLGDFVAAGFDPGAVDLVIHTHLHEDHIGWDTHLVDGRWVPTFPSARHVYVGDELDYAKQPDRRVGDDPFAESVQPILDAGLAWQVTNATDLGDGLQLVPTAGHTPGHASLAIDTGAEQLVITGDVIDHPFQCARPVLAHGSDWKPALARETRHAFLDDHCRRGSVIAGTHFPTSPVGLVEAAGPAWRFEPVAPIR